MQLKILHNFSSENDKIVIRNTLAAFLIKGGSLLISFVSMPAYIRYFDNQQVLGVWFTVLSVLSWVLTFDFGIGNGLRNQLVEALVKNDKDEIRKTISSSYIIIGALTIAAITGGSIGFQFVDWNKFFGISDQLVSPSVMYYVTLCAFITMMLQFFLRLISFVLYALQESAINNLLTFITSASLVLFVLLAPSYDNTSNLKTLSIVYLLCVNVPLFIATFWVFNRKLKKCFPTIKYFEWTNAASILRLGGVFFYNQIMYTIITGSNSFLIARFIGLGSVVEYQVYYRIFSIFGMVFGLSLTPLWSAITKAFSQNDHAWIKRYFRILNWLVILVSLFHFLVIPFLSILVRLWLGNQNITLNYLSAVIFALFGSIFVFHNVLSTFACGIGKIRLQAVCYTIGVVLKIGLVYIGTSIWKDWILIVASDVLILTPYCLLQYFSLRKEFYKKATETAAS